jgi:hypothetical protein
MGLPPTHANVDRFHRPRLQTELGTTRFTLEKRSHQRCTAAILSPAQARWQVGFQAVRLGGGRRPNTTSSSLALMRKSCKLALKDIEFQAAYYPPAWGDRWEQHPIRVRDARFPTSGNSLQNIRIAAVRVARRLAGTKVGS